jgi:hypothetical protein
MYFFRNTCARLLFVSARTNKRTTVCDSFPQHCRRKAPHAVDEKRRMQPTKTAACSRRKTPHAADEKRHMPPTKSAACSRRKAPHAADEKHRMPPTKSAACRRLRI